MTADHGGKETTTTDGDNAGTTVVGADVRPEPDGDKAIRVPGPYARMTVEDADVRSEPAWRNGLQTGYRPPRQPRRRR
jgi:hypothetical protein